MTPNWKTPGATLALRADAPRADWLAMRTQGLGGSDIPAITGAAHYTTPFALWQEKAGLTEPEEKSNDLFWFGHNVEPILADRFTADTGIATRNIGMLRSKAHGWQLANPDRLTADGGILEIKTTSRYTDHGKAYLAGQAPEAHRQQLTWYMHITGRRIGHLIALVDRQVITLRVDYDEEYAKTLEDAAAEFWELVTTRTAPPLNLATVTPSEVAARFPDVIDPDSAAEAPIPASAIEDVDELAELKAEKKSIDEEIKAIETRLKAQIGDREYLTVDGRPLARWQAIAGRKTFDKKAVLNKLAAERGIDPTPQALKSLEAEFTKTGAPTRRLTLIEGAAA